MDLDPEGARTKAIPSNDRMIEKYYKILGISEGATLIQIKKAYRKRAMQLHPDVNKSPDAQEQFIFLNEAYEYLQKVKTGKIYSHSRGTYKRPKRRQKSTSGEEQAAREKARARARAHAKMKYEAYIKTDFYKTTVALNILSDFFFLVITILIFVGGPITGYILKGFPGVGASIFLMFVTVHVWADTLVNKRPSFSLKELRDAFLHIFKLKYFQLILVVIGNAILAYRTGLNTFISFYILALLFAVTIGFGFYIQRKNKEKFKKRLLIFGLYPAVLNIFFIVNFYASFNEVKESYVFQHKFEIGRWGNWHKTATIILPKNKYGTYLGIRSFIDFEEMRTARKITYTFADGLFGMRVMKDYDFHLKEYDFTDGK